MRMLLFSDLHLRPETEEVCFQVLEEVRKEAILHKVDAIGFLGDWWHLRYQVPVYLLNRVAEWVELTSNVCDLIMLPGNHDQIDLMGENALQVFEAHGARVYSEPITDDWGSWMPYRKDASVVATHLKNLDHHILFAHLPVLGALMNNKMEDKDGLSSHHFDGFSRVLLGHYHKQQDFLNGKITYIGSPWQTRADEYGQKKGFAIWDATTGLLHRLDRHFGKHYHRFEAANAMTLKQQILEANPAPEDILTVVMPTKGDLDAGLKLIHKMGYQHINGNATDLTVPQPRFGFQKGASINEYAALWAKEKGAQIGSYEELMAIWGEIAE